MDNLLVTFKSKLVTIGREMSIARAVLGCKDCICDPDEVECDGDCVCVCACAGGSGNGDGDADRLVVGDITI